MKQAETVSLHFHLDKSQAELDFVDVPVNGDLPIFLDPFAISQRVDPWSQESHRALVAFFEHSVDLIRAGRHEEAYALFGHLREPNETRLGLSKGKAQGAGIGDMQARQLVDALSRSTAVRTGFLKSLEECELMIDGISSDKISDLTTNIIRHQLVEYTQIQCDLHGIPLHEVPLSPVYNPDLGGWESRFHKLPVAAGQPLVLVPKILVRHVPAYQHSDYYNHFVLRYLQAEHLNAGSSLVRALKNGGFRVYKKDLKREFPLTKKFLFEFSREHPEVLEAYRDELARLEATGAKHVDDEAETFIAALLEKSLNSIEPGPEHASEYHRVMIGILEFLFFPILLNPRREAEIHQGRKRIDIVMQNGARGGAFFRVHNVGKLPCAYVMIECKNYSKDPNNPELDQIAGRFSPNRGKLGLLCYRSTTNRALIVKRCRDTFKDERGLILPLDDATITELLRSVGIGQRPLVDKTIDSLIDEIWFS